MASIGSPQSLLGTALASAFGLLLSCGGTSPGSDGDDGDESDDGGGATDETSDGGTTEVADGDGVDDGAADSGSTGEPPTGGPADGDVTYHRDVRPLLQRHCVHCHSPGQIAPYDLTSYDGAWPLREAIAAATDTRRMPPWNPGQGCAQYLDDPSLPDEAIATIAAWVDEDGPLGDPADYVAPDVAEPPGLSRVDVTLTLPEPYTPVQAPDDYRCFLMDWPRDEVSYITGFSVSPDNLQTVHHVITYAIGPDAVADYEALDAADPGQGYTCFGGAGGGGDWGSGRWLGAWAPGGASSDFPDGTGLRMEPGSKVVVQIHYNAGGGDVGPDRSSVDYKVDDTVEREAFMMPWADPDWLAGGMHIPAGSPDTTHVWELDPTLVMSFLTDAIPGFSPIEIHSVSHHMHLRGVSGRQAIVRSDGSEDCLVDVPAYDFNWQTRYRFVQPQVLRPGDVLSLSCTWDNTAGDADLEWGEGTGDEMCLGVYFVTAAAR